MVDATDSKSVEGNLVWVRVPPPVLRKSPANSGVTFFLTPFSEATKDRTGDNGENSEPEERRVEGLRGLALHAGQDVRVGPEGGGYVLVAQRLGDHLDLGVGQEERLGGVGMPEVVEVDRGGRRPSRVGAESRQCRGYWDGGSRPASR